MKPCSSLAIALLVDLTLPDSNKNAQRFPGVLPFLCGILLVFDPRMNYLGASDAAHNVAVFSFAMILWFYCDSLYTFARVLKSARGMREIMNGVVILVSSMLLGMTRPELLAGVAVVPLLATLHQSASPKRHVYPIACILVGASLVVVAWAGKPLGVALEPVTMSQVSRWLEGGTPRLLLIPWFFLVGDSIRRSTCRPLLLILSYYIAAAPRIPTGYASGTYTGLIEEVIAAFRYDAITHLILLLSISHGFATLEAIGKSIDKPALRRVFPVIAFAGGFGFCLEWSAFTTGGAHRFPKVPSSFQMEYEFLSRTLPLLPKHPTVATVWNDHFPSRVRDPDAGNAWPGSLLSYLRPDIKFVVISPRNSIVVPEGSYVFQGAMCSFDVNVLGSFVPAADVEYMREFVTICRQLALETSPMAGVSDDRRGVADRRFGRNFVELSLRRLQKEFRL